MPVDIPDPTRTPTHEPDDTDQLDVDVSALEESDDPEHRRFKLTRDLRKRLDRYLCDRFPGLSRSRLQKLINEGAVTVNRRQPKSSTILRLDDEIDVLVPPPPIKQIHAESIPLNIIFEDEHLIVINKQMDLVVHPARSNLTGTLLNGLAWYFKDAKTNGLEALSKIGVEEFRPGIVHRLDKDTTGCIVLAKHEEAHWRLARQFEHRQVQKYYLAITHGRLPQRGGVIDQPIGKHPTVKEAYAVRHDHAGRHAVTLYRVREIFDGYSLVELELKTGRTHQIRVHLTWLGCPIISDIIYGGQPIGPAELDRPPDPAGAQPMLTFARKKEDGVKIWDRMAQRDDLIIRRPALHAAVLQFQHPMTENTIRFTAPIHPDFNAVLQYLRQHHPDSGPLNPDGAEVESDLMV